MARRLGPPLQCSSYLCPSAFGHPASTLEGFPGTAPGPTNSMFIILMPVCIRTSRTDPRVFSHRHVGYLPNPFSISRSFTLFLRLSPLSSQPTCAVGRTDLCDPKTAPPPTTGAAARLGKESIGWRQSVSIFHERSIFGTTRALGRAQGRHIARAPHASSTTGMGLCKSAL